MGHRLCIDVSNTLETTTLSGIQRVTLELAHALGTRVPVIALDGRSGRFLPLRPDQRQRLRLLRQGTTGRSVIHRLESRAVRAAPAVRRAYRLGPETVLVDLEACWHAPTERAELLPRLVGVPTAALVHDLLPITNPEWFAPEAVTRFCAWFDAHVAADSLLVALSNTTADAVAAVGRPRPRVIPMGSSGSPSVSRGNGVVMVGTIEPRKGHALVLDALDLLGNDAPVVDVVGRAGWDTADLVERLERHPKIRWHRGVSDTDLETIWSLSGLLLQPTSAEGFGLPVVEALQRRVAVVSSDIDVMGEVGRGQTTLLPLDPAIWAQTLGAFAADPKRWPRPERLDWPTWHDSADALVDEFVVAGLLPGDHGQTQ